ncbi:MAG: hypothetical protein ACRDPE_02250 [Solirubrobacterales bacterium]
MTWKTLGEAAIERELETEQRLGTEHYVVGQHHVKIEPREDPNILVAVLTFCSAMGVVIMPLVKVMDGEWEPAVDRFRLVGLGYDYGLRQIPPRFALSDEVKEAIAAAEEEAER